MNIRMIVFGLLFAAVGAAASFFVLRPGGSEPLQAQNTVVQPSAPARPDPAPQLTPSVTPNAQPEPVRQPAPNNTQITPDYVQAQRTPPPPPVAQHRPMPPTQVSVEFHEALAPYGRWQRHPRWGAVWVPARVERDWRPYTQGRWVYTEDWGWYWDSDEEWGWVAYHYGRWVNDRHAGWMWIPGDEWAPAWVSWRRGGSEVGWAPLPPEEYYADIDENPDAWVFVNARDVVARSIAQVLMPRQRNEYFVRETVLVNRTVIVRGARIAANVGVPPSYIAVYTGRPLRVSRVEPVVVRGTYGVRGAYEIDPRDQRERRPRRAVVQEAERNIPPASEVPAPRRFQRGERRDTPDAPSVFRQAQPQTDAPKAKQERPDEAPKAKQEKRDDAPRFEPKKKDDAAPKAKQERPDEAPKGPPQRPESPLRHEKKEN